MSSRSEGGQPLRHLYLFVAIEGFLEGAEIYNGVHSLIVPRARNWFANGEERWEGRGRKYALVTFH